MARGDVFREQAAKFRAEGNPAEAERYECLAIINDRPWATRNGAARVAQVAANANRNVLLLNAAGVERQRVEWLWPGRIPLGKLTLIAGDGGCGKSMLTTDIAARVSSGSAWPDRSGAPSSAGVVLLSAEDDPGDTIRPRLDAHRADCSRVQILQAAYDETRRERAVTLADVDRIEEAIDLTPGCAIVIIDPISAYIEKGTDDHRTSEVRGMLRPLSDLAARKRVAIVAVHHLNKAAGVKALYRVTGSGAYSQAVRAVWGVAIDEGDESPLEPDRRRLLVCLKLNCGRPSEPWGYRIVTHPELDVGMIEWELEAAEGVDADSAFGVERKRSRATPAQDAASEFLREVLADGPLAVKELQERAKDDGHSWATIRRVRERAGVEIDKAGFQGESRWFIPASELFTQ